VILSKNFKYNFGKSMKTQIIRLDGYDDVTSACDKLTWGKAGRIVMVWPERGRVLASRLELNLLLRRSRELGAQLALVTRDGEVTALARDLGIPVFRQLEKAQRGAWRSGRRKPTPWPVRRGIAGLRTVNPRAGPGEKSILNALAARLIIFSLAILAMLGLAGFVLPSATIRLALPQVPQKIRWQGQALAAQSGAGQANIIPLHSTELVVEARDGLQTTGLVREPVLAASGMARFTNLTALPVDIPAGTAVSTGDAAPVRFATVAAAQAPAGVGKTVDVSIRAQMAGLMGNLPKDSLNTLQGTPGLQLTVNNPAPTSGGTERVYPAPDDTDRAALKKSLLEVLRKNALEQASAQLPEGALLIPASLNQGEVIADQSFPADRQPSDRLEESLRARYTIAYLAKGDLQNAAAAALDAALPSGYRAVDGPVQVELVSQPVMSVAGAAAWQIDATRQIEPILPAGQAANWVRGRPVSEAAAALSDRYHLAASPTIQIQPQGWPWLPFLAFRIEVGGG
jgi:hypothetical protein